MPDSAAACSVLVIDDEPLIRSFATRALRAEGFAVAEAADAREGLELALADPPDVVLLDLGLPDLEGAEVLRRLRHERPDQAVLVWSATADPATERRCLLLGARACLRKPTPVAELLQSVGSAGRPRATANGASVPPGSRTCGRGHGAPGRRRAVADPWRRDPWTGTSSRRPRNWYGRAVLA